MFRRCHFVLLFLMLLAGLAWWADRLLPPTVKAAPQLPVVSVSEPDTAKRIELLELVDRIVAYEHYYHSVYGHFTQLLPRLGIKIPKAIAEIYEVRIAEASADRFLLTAFSEVKGRAVDRFSVDQDYVVNSTFPLPVPRPEYLRVHAGKHLRTLQETPAGRLVEESGLFKGYFRYEVRDGNPGQRTAFAVGIRPPVLGLQLEGKNLALGFDAEPASMGSRGTGQTDSHVMSAGEEVNLAQRIFYGEYGRYARNWAELSEITSFRFEEKSEVGLMPSELVAETEVEEGAVSRSPAQSTGLVIEAIHE